MLEFFDFILAPIYFFIILFILNARKNKKIATNPAYEYFIPGFIIKVLGGIALTFIYIYYYGGGDTISYYNGMKAINRVTFLHPSIGLEMIFQDRAGKEYFWAYFNDYTGTPLWFYFFRDKDAFSVIKYTLIPGALSFNYFLPTVVILATLAYVGVWKFYRMLYDMYPEQKKPLAYAALFIPSVVFWGSGILKDTYTLSAAMWFTYCVYMIFQKKEKIPINIITLLFNVGIIITIKPYVIIALLPGTLLWIFHKRLTSIKNKTLRVMAAPMFIAGSLGLGMLILSSMSESLGVYSSLDSVMEKAVITQQDLIRSSEYGENYFDIGKFDKSIGSMLSKAPIAISAALYRPFIWEARNVVMIMSGLENTFILLLSIYILFKLGPLRTGKYIFEDPFILFGIVFTIFFSFSVGLTTANFGALVRYRIPQMPFFVASLLLMYNKLIAYRTMQESEKPKRGKR